MTAHADGPADPHVFPEVAHHEIGFAAIYERVIGPEIDAQAALWRRLRHARRRQRIAGLVLLGLTAVLAVGLAVSSLAWAVLLAATVAVVGLPCGMLLALRMPGHEGRRLRELLIVAACEQLGDLRYQRVAGRRVEFDHHVELALVPSYELAHVEDFFEGRHRDLGFRLIEASLRRDNGRIAFHGMLLEIDLPELAEGRVTVAHRRDDDNAPLPGTRRLGTPPGRPVVLKVDPMFHRRFDVFADHEESAHALLTPPMRLALTWLANHWGGTPWQVGQAYGKLLVALPVKRPLFEPQSARTLVFDPIADARNLLEELRLPRRIIDALHGIDANTGGRLRAH